ncbi:MAG: glycosyltransferase [Pseudomonadota bacterium]
MNHPILPISLIVTCFNEVSNVAGWCKSLLDMDAFPSEVIVSDSDSTDNTVNELRKHLEGHGFDLVILGGRCSISEGRNKAIAHARFERLAITDFGVTFGREWLSALNESLEDSDWVGGCYTMVWRNSVQRAYCRLFDVDSSRLDEQSFLPSSRSFAITKSAFHSAGGYDTSLLLGEDTDLVLRLRTMPLRYRLERKAVVFWLPRDSFGAIYLQNYRYAYWDGRAQQSPGRWLHLLFWLVVTLIPVVFLVGTPLLVSLNSFAGAVALLYAKASRNTLRGSSQSWARPMDMLTYYIATSGSVFGYVLGTLARLLVKNA